MEAAKPQRAEQSNCRHGAWFWGPSLDEQNHPPGARGVPLSCFCTVKSPEIAYQPPQKLEQNNPQERTRKAGALQNSTKKHNQKHGISHKKNHAISPRSTKTFKKRRQESTSKAQNFEQKRFQILSQTHIKALSRGSEKIETAKRNTWTFFNTKQAQSEPQKTTHFVQSNTINGKTQNHIT